MHATHHVATKREQQQQVPANSSYNCREVPHSLQSYSAEHAYTELPNVGRVWNASIYIITLL